MSVPEMVGQPAAYRLYRWAWAGLDWLYPPRCGGCGSQGQRWCSACQSRTCRVPDTVCQRCGHVLPGSGVCKPCQTHLPAYQALRSWAIFADPLRAALHRLKYKGDISLGDALAQPLIGFLNNLHWPVDLIAPVPASPKRRVQRGYNQAALLALPLALGTGLSYRPQALHKVRETQSQVHLTVSERHQNVVGAFEAHERLVAQKVVLVVDDVTTSGATLESCAAALLQAGAQAVYGLTLAQAA